VTKINAHPHASSDNSFVLAQNGIVENFVPLKQKLQARGHHFVSQTDTEVIVRLIEEVQKTQQDFLTALRTAFLQLEGRNTIIALTRDGEIVAARNGSPLVIGLNTKTNELYFSSDTLSFAPYVNKMMVMENNQLVVVSKEQKISVLDIVTGRTCLLRWENLAVESTAISKNGYDHFMIKEIRETPTVIAQIAKEDETKLQALATAIKTAHQVYVIGSGTAGIASAQIAFYLRIFGQVNAINLIGADARSYYPLFQSSDLIIAPSQSGETADVLEVLEVAQQKQMKIASLVNMPGSMMTRMSDYPFMCPAGPEICVMSTKVFTTQITWGYLVAKTVQGKYQEGVNKLHVLAAAIDGYLSDSANHQVIKRLATHLVDKPHIFLLGKYQNQAIMNEGMVKLVEATYKHAHAVPAGDLKHYAITLMEKGVPVIVAVSNDVVKNDLTTAINEVRLRGAEVIAMAHESSDNYDYLIKIDDTGETDAIGMTIPLQLLAYYMAMKLGNNVDKPRNIAKSVTVK
jgi:glucosamine--fructose-6-phosphate aminotransferase (isomerizing)